MPKNYHLTLPQEDILNEQLIYKELPIYNIGAKIRIEGKICYETLSKAYDHLIATNDAYRTVLLNDLSGFFIQDHHYLTLPFIDFSNQSDPEEEADQYMSMEFKKSFNLHSGDYLFRFCLIKVSESKFYLFSVYHHLIVDGYGTSLMFQRLVTCYNELKSAKPLSESSFSIASFAENDDDYRLSAAYQDDSDYWKETFQHLPNNYIPLVSKKAVSSSRKKLILTRAIYDKINERSKENGVTSFHFLLGVLFVLLGKYFQESDLTIGLPTLNRSSAQFKKTVGLFMGINLLRLELLAGLTFSELLKQIRAKLRQDYKHQRYPIGKLIRDAGCLKEVDRLLNVFVSYEKQDYSFNFLDTRTAVIPLTHHSERVALALYVREFDSKEDVVLDFDYNQSYITDSMISYIVDGFNLLVNQVTAGPDSPLTSLNILNASAITQISVDFNDTFKPLDSHITVVSLFENSVKLYPHKVALTDGLSMVTYAQLNNFSQRLAKKISQTFLRGKKPPVAIALNRSVDLVVAILGVLKSGACFIPIDPGYPAHRIAYILAHAGCTHLITDEQSKNAINTSDYQVFSVNTDQNSEVTEVDIDYPAQNDTAYIIYTSGTTGNPKGVEIGHRSLLNFLLSMQEQPGMAFNDKLYAVTTCSFDIFYLEIFLPLIAGAEIKVARMDMLADVGLLMIDIQEFNPTVIQATPSFFQKLLDAGWNGGNDLKILCGGDALNSGLAQLLMVHCSELWNMYGPTETTIWSSIKKIRSLKDARSIGKPIRNTEIYILGREGEILPVGSVGSVFIAGEGLAKGYYKDPELTDEKFFLHPGIQKKIYDTGDLGKWLENGEIELAGRKDFQVKIRGFRIEIAEVEHAISELDFIDQVAVVAKEFNHFKRLIAYFSGSNKQEQEIKSYLIHQLPRYMVPDVFIFLEEFPLTANGKIDRKVLLNMPLVLKEKAGSEIGGLSETQADLIEIYEKVLGINGLDANSDFFEQGGNSLNVSALSRQISEKFGININFNQIYESSSIWELSKFIENSGSETENINDGEWYTRQYYPLTGAQLNIFYECQKPGKAMLYNMNAGFMVQGHLDEHKLAKAINRIIAANDALNMNFKGHEGMPVQLFTPKQDFQLKQLAGNDVNQVARQFFDEEFNLENDLLLRCGILKLEKQDFLFFSTHHLIMDGYSLDIFIQHLRHSLVENYLLDMPGEYNTAFRRYLITKSSLPEREEARLHWDAIFKAFNYQSIFSHFQEDSLLFVAKQEIYTTVEGELLEQIRKVGSQWKMSFNTALTLLTGVFISKLTDARDFMLGSTYHGRDSHQENHLGMFVHTLPLRILIEPEKTVEAHVQEFCRMMARSQQYCDYPLSERYYKNQPVFETLVSFQKNNFALNADIDFGVFGLTLLKKLPYRTGRLPFIFNFQEHPDALIISIISDHHYSEEFTVFVSTSFISFLKQFAAESDAQIQAYNIFNTIQNYNEDIEFNF